MPQRRPSFVKYLQRHCVPEVNRLLNIPSQQHYEHTLIIPAYNETPVFLQNLKTRFAPRCATLFIVVINQPDDDHDTTNNNQLFRWAMSSGKVVWEADNMWLLDWAENGSSLLLVDRFRDGRHIPRRQGVGLARKIGCDLAVQFAALGLLRSTWLYSTDADASLPDDYFSRTQHIAGASAATFPFTHSVDNSPLGKAQYLYEQSLHYYVDGLRWAGSPYGFHTIGSCLAIDIDTYCQVRGFPPRAGGEDFYLLNKAAKINAVATLPGEPIRLALRKSARVPFGTGPAVNKIAALTDPELEYRGYDPRGFLHLRELLQHFRELWRYRQRPENWLSALPSATTTALTALGFDAFTNHLVKQANTPEQCERQIPQWFDGFRTLKFIRHLQQHDFPAVPLLQGVAQLEALRQQPGGG